MILRFRCRDFIFQHFSDRVSRFDAFSLLLGGQKDLKQLVAYIFKIIKQNAKIS